MPMVEVSLIGFIFILCIAAWTISSFIITLLTKYVHFK